VFDSLGGIIEHRVQCRPFLACQRIVNPLAHLNPGWLGRSGTAAYGLRTANSLAVRQLDNLKRSALVPLVELSHREQQPAEPLALDVRDAVSPRLVVDRLHGSPYRSAVSSTVRKIGVTRAVTRSPS
jgi:hypothetical protein